jgi:hypothetical protein
MEKSCNRAQAHIRTKAAIKCGLSASCFFVMVACVNAQDPIPIDVAFRYELATPPPYRIGTRFKLTYVYSHSSIYFVDVWVTSLPGVPPNVQPFDQIQRVGGSCEALPGCGIQVQCLFSDTVPPMSEKRCDLNFDVLGSNNNPVRLRAVAFINPADRENFPDPDFSNNTDQVSIGVLPNVQAPMSPLSYVLTGFGVLGLGMFAARRA